MSKEVDNVNHPNHYEKSCSLECIEVMELVLGKEATMNFCLGNAFKYMWRYKNKNGAEDLDKAHWYLSYVKNNYIDLEGSDDEIIKTYDRLFDLYVHIGDKEANGGKV